VTKPDRFLSPSPLVLFACVLVLQACSSGSSTDGTTTPPPPSPSSPSTGTLKVQLSQATCTGGRTITVTVDGSALDGAYTVPAGASVSFTESAGSHQVGAAVTAAGGQTWAPQTVTVPAGSAYTLVLSCT
jgi:hypothetical protein